MKGLSKKQLAINPHLLDVVNLQEHAHRRLSSYSGGMKQRILIAQALLNDPDVRRFLDEPTAGQDPKEQINIRNFIATIAMNKIVLIATHVVTDIEFIAKEVILLKKGRLIMKGEPTHLLKTMEGHVFEVRLDTPEQIDLLRQQYRISNISNGRMGAFGLEWWAIKPRLVIRMKKFVHIWKIYICIISVTISNALAMDAIARD